MKKIFLVFILLVLGGCASQTDVAQVGTDDVKTTQIVELDDLIAESRSTTEAKKNIGIKINLEGNNKKAGINDYVVFGVLLNNAGVKTDNFLIDVEFFEARDSFNNKIETDSDVIKTWLNPSNFELFVLESQQSKFVPVIIKVGEEIKPGVSTVKGTYKFKIKSYTEIEGSFRDEYDSDKIIFVSVNG